MKIRENLILLRANFGVTQKELANALGMTTQAISYYETGERKPNPEILIKLADYFSVSIDWILGRDTSKDVEPTLLNIEELKRQKRIEILKKELEELQSQHYK